MKARTSLVATLLVFAVCVSTGRAASLFWHGDGSNVGGAGTWNTTNLNWAASPGGTPKVAWNNANQDSAIFEPAAGAVTVSGTIDVNRITTGPAGYSFTTGILRFVGPNAGVTTNHTTGTTTISAAYQGDSLTKEGPGRLEINNSTANNTLGKYILNEGILTAATTARFFNPSSLVQDYFTFNGGGLAFTFGTTTLNGDFGPNRGVTILAGGAFLGASAAGNVGVISAPIVGTAGGGLTITGGAPFFSPVASGGIWILANTANSYDGPTTVTTGTLRLGASEVIPNGSTVTLTGGHLDLNGFNETVGTVTVNSSASTIIPGSGTPTLTASGYDLRASGTITAILGGPGAVTKTTAGTVTLNGANTYSGDTTIQQGQINFNATGTLGNGAGTIILAGGRLNTTVNRAVGNPLTNAINLTTDSEITTTSTAGTVNLNFTTDNVSGSAGTLTFRNDAPSGTGVFDPRFSGSGFDFTRPIAIANGAFGTTRLNFFNPTGTQTFSGVISGNGSIRRSVTTGTGGDTILTGDNTYSGGTVINNSRLLVNNTSGSGTGTGTVTVGGGGTLGGTGSISGDVIVNGTGTVAPGMSIGSLAVGSVSFNNANNTFEYEYDSDNLLADLLNVDGNLNINAAAMLSLTDLGSTAMALGTKFTLISYSGAWNLGEFDLFPNGSLFTVGLNEFRIKYDDIPLGSANGGAHANALTITAVPEPSSMILVGLALAGLGLATRRRSS